MDFDDRNRVKKFKLEPRDDVGVGQYQGIMVSLKAFGGKGVCVCVCVVGGCGWWWGCVWVCGCVCGCVGVGVGVPML
jgi:hypothetical protein